MCSTLTDQFVSLPYRVLLNIAQNDVGNGHFDKHIGGTGSWLDPRKGGHMVEVLFLLGELLQQFLALEKMRGCHHRRQIVESISLKVKIKISC